jgi:hypothetical protein
MTNPNVPPNVQSNGIETESLKDLAKQLQQAILLHERAMLAQSQESEAHAKRVDTMAKALNDLRDQNINLLQQTAATMEVATSLINAADEQLDRLTEITLAVTTIYDQASAQQEEL